MAADGEADDDVVWAPDVKAVTEPTPELAENAVVDRHEQVADAAMASVAPPEAVVKTEASGTASMADLQAKEATDALAQTAPHVAIPHATGGDHAEAEPAVASSASHHATPRLLRRRHHLQQ